METIVEEGNLVERKRKTRPSLYAAENGPGVVREAGLKASYIMPVGCLF